MEPKSDLQVPITKDFLEFFTKEKEARIDFLDFLEGQDLEQLGKTNSKIQRIIKLHLKRKNKKFDETTFEGMLAKLIHQMKRKPKGNILRTSIFKIDYKVMVDPYDWVLLNETEEENNSLIEDLRGIIPTNMLRDFERFVYYSSELKKYLMLH